MKLDESQKHKVLQKAEKLADEFDSEEAVEFAKKHEGAQWYENFILLYQMVTDKGFSLEKSTYMLIAGALAYVVLPIDIIPDFIPGVGFVDDVFVLGWVIKTLSDEIERFKMYKKEV